MFRWDDEMKFLEKINFDCDFVGIFLIYFFIFFSSHFFVFFIHSILVFKGFYFCIERNHDGLILEKLKIQTLLWNYVWLFPKSLFFSRWAEKQPMTDEWIIQSQSTITKISSSSLNDLISSIKRFLYKKTLFFCRFIFLCPSQFSIRLMMSVWVKLMTNKKRREINLIVIWKNEEDKITK